MERAWFHFITICSLLVLLFAVPVPARATTTCISVTAHPSWEASAPSSTTKIAETTEPTGTIGITWSSATPWNNGTVTIFNDVHQTTRLSRSGLSPTTLTTAWVNTRLPGAGRANNTITAFAEVPVAVRLPWYGMLVSWITGIPNTMTATPTPPNPAPSNQKSLVIDRGAYLAHRFWFDLSLPYLLGRVATIGGNGSVRALDTLSIGDVLIGISGVLATLRLPRVDMPPLPATITTNPPTSGTSLTDRATATFDRVPATALIPWPEPLSAVRTASTARGGSRLETAGQPTSRSSTIHNGGHVTWWGTEWYPAFEVVHSGTYTTIVYNPPIGQ
jgi:hypothetical protein